MGGGTLLRVFAGGIPPDEGYGPRRTGVFCCFQGLLSQKSPRQFVSARREDSIFRHRRKDGKLIDVEVDAALIPFHGHRDSAVHAITKRRRAEQRLLAQHATTRALAESSTLAEASPECFGPSARIWVATGANCGEWTRAGTQSMRCTQVWHPESQPLPGMQRFVRNTVYARGQGIPGSLGAQQAGGGLRILPNILNYTALQPWANMVCGRFLHFRSVKQGSVGSHQHF